MIFYSASVIMLVGCSFDTERDNPLDPKSDDYSFNGSVRGYLTMLDMETPIKGALISLLPISECALSEEDGYYEINGLPDGNYTYEVKHPQYKTVSGVINIKSYSSKNIDFALNAHPVFDSVSVTSQTYRISISGNKYYRVFVYAEITDPDGVSDLKDLALLEWNGNLDTLSKVSGTEVYSLELGEESFPDSLIENMLGINYFIKAVDIHGDTATSPPAQIARLIDNDVVPQSPYLTIMEAQTNFIWHVKPIFWFTNYKYRLQIFTDGEDRLVYEKIVPIHDMYIEYFLFDYFLESDDYYWVVILEDSYGNFSSSEHREFDVNL